MKSFQRISIAFIPLHEFGDAVVQTPVGFVPAFSLQLGGVGVSLVYVTRLHGQEFLLGGLAVGVLDFADEIHQLHGIAAAVVEHLDRLTL